MKRLMVPPLPAASRPSNTMTCRSPLAWLHFCSFEQFDLQQPLLLLVVFALHALVVRVALAPGVDDLAAGHQ